MSLGHTPQSQLPVVPGDVMGISSSLDQLIDCCMFGTKLQPDPMMVIFRPISHGFLPSLPWRNVTNFSQNGVHCTCFLSMWKCCIGYMYVVLYTEWKLCNFMAIKSFHSKSFHSQIKFLKKSKWFHTWYYKWKWCLWKSVILSHPQWVLDLTSVVSRRLQLIVVVCEQTWYPMLSFKYIYS